MDFYADMCRDARGWLKVYGHQQWERLSEDKVALAFFRLMHCLPLAVPRTFESSTEPLPTLTMTEAGGLVQLRAEVEAGAPLWPRLSTTTSRNHADGLLNDWR